VVVAGEDHLEGMLVAEVAGPEARVDLQKVTVVAMVVQAEPVIYPVL
jgi:hypothetical protein